MKIGMYENNKVSSGKGEFQTYNTTSPKIRPVLFGDSISELAGRVAVSVCPSGFGGNSVGELFSPDGHVDSVPHIHLELDWVELEGSWQPSWASGRHYFLYLIKPEAINKVLEHFIDCKIRYHCTEGEGSDPKNRGLDLNDIVRTLSAQVPQFVVEVEGKQLMPGQIQRHALLGMQKVCRSEIEKFTPFDLESALTGLGSLVRRVLNHRLDLHALADALAFLATAWHFEQKDTMTPADLLLRVKIKKQIAHPKEVSKNEVLGLILAARCQN